MKPCATFHDLEGVSVFITGGGSGIGAALTEGFIAQGAKVAFVQRSDAGAFCDGIEARYGTRLLFRPCDITDTGALRAAIGQAAAAHGPIRVLVNNAGNDTRHRLADHGPREWSDALAVNLGPHYFTAQAVAPAMGAAGGGAIINFSSIAYLMGIAEYPAYVAAKAGVTGLTRALARELGPDGIRVNAVLPGWVLTRRQLELWASPEALAGHMERQCLKRHLAPEDIVETVLFLASGASAMITGQAIAVDGGVVATG